MSSVGVLIEKESKCFVRRKKKNLSVRRKIFKVWRGVGEKNYKCGISGVRKKRIGRKISEEKKIKVFLGKKKVKIFVAVKES